MKRRFDYAAFRAGWRELCALHRLDPQTGAPYRFEWPAERQQPLGRPWWCAPDLWLDAGPAHSVVEAAAVTSIAAQARATVFVPTDKPDALDNIIDYADQHMQEVRENPAALHDLQLRGLHWHEFIGAYDPAELPLSLLHEIRGVEVVELEGMRVEVPIKQARGWDKWRAYKESLKPKVA